MQNIEDDIQNKLEFRKEDFPELHQAARNESIILFLGAGIPKLYGCCLWFEMALKIVERLRKKGVINFSECEILNKESLSDPRKIISICYELATEKNKLTIYKKSIEDSLKIKKNKKDMCTKIYKKIFSIKSLVYLSTNIDLGMNFFINSNDKYENRRVFDLTLEKHRMDIKYRDFNILKDGNIIYLHGIIDNFKDLVLSIDKYLYHYHQNNSFLNRFFEEIEKTNCFIIFIGYSLYEWDIIEKIYKMKNSLKERTSILLSPVYTHDYKKFILESVYYRSFGVIPVPYIIDKNGYEEIFIVLNKLSKVITKSYPHGYDRYSEIETI
jgi:hypothetical protein